MPYLQTDWYDEGHLEELYPHLELGCRLEFIRTGYSHWALYVGQQDNSEDSNNNIGKNQKGCYIIHRSVPPEYERQDLLRKCKNFGIVRVTIEEALSKSKVRINNEMDDDHRPKDPLEIVAIAEKYMNSPKQEVYNLFTNNCEHFVNRCRYGRNKSKQINDIVLKSAITTSMVIASLGTRIALGLAASSLLGIPVVGPVIFTVGGVGSSLPVVVHAVQHVMKKNEKKKITSKLYK